MPPLKTMEDDGKEYFTIAMVTTPDGKQEPLRCSSRPSPNETNLLFVLCEHVSRELDMDHICHRLQTSPNAIRILATKVRKRLHYDWAIVTRNSKGMRIIFLGTELAAAPITRMEIDKQAMRRTYQHSQMSIDCMKVAAKARWVSRRKQKRVKFH